MKKFFSMLLTIVMVVGMMPGFAIPASAADEPIGSYAGGTGTKDDPFLISNVDELVYFNQMCAYVVDFDNCGDPLGWGGYHGAYFKLTTDIDCSSLDEWTPCTFAGHFDGDGHTISKLKIGYKSQENGEYIYCGFFDVLSDGSVSDITFDTVEVTIPEDAEMDTYASVYAGVVAGEIYYANVDSVTVKNSTVSKVSSGGYWSNVLVGGIAGGVDGAYINKCEVIDTTVNSNKGYVGGLIGRFYCLYYDVKEFKEAGYIFRFGGETGKFGIENSMIDENSSVSGNYGVVGGMIG